MPAVAEPPVITEAPDTSMDGGFMDRLTQTIKADPAAVRNPGDAPTPPPAPLTQEKAPDAPTGLETAKKDPPVAEQLKPEAKSASDMLKKLAIGEKAEDKPQVPPTPEQKKEYSMKELRLRAEKADSLEKELADVRKEIETAKAAGATPDQLKLLTEERDTLKTDIANYEKKLAAADVMQSKHYIENVTKPMETMWGELVKASDEFKFSINDLGNALQIPEHRQRLAALSKVFDAAEGDIDPLNRQELVNGSLEFLRREYLGRQLMGDATKVRDALKADEARKATEEKDLSTKTFNDQAETIFKQMFSEESLADMPFLAPKGDDGKPTPNKELLDQIRKSATTAKEPWRQALDSYSTELLPVVMEYAKGRDARIAELEDRIGKLSGAGPKGGGPITHEENSGDNGKSLQERLETMMKSQGRG